MMVIDGQPWIGRKPLTVYMLIAYSMLYVVLVCHKVLFTWSVRWCEADISSSQTVVRLLPYIAKCLDFPRLHFKSGISQGCTLSPLIFVILMSVLMHDALSMLQGDAREAFERGDLADVVYADDTLLMGVSTLYLTEYMQAVAAAGRKYGMELHYGKFQLLGVRCNPDIRLPDNTCIQTQQCMMYLGMMMTADGKHGNELSRRIGIAKSDFAALQKVWKHSSLHYRQKVQIYKTVVESRLLYSLCALVLTKQEKRRLDGFQNRCLRSILGIQPSFLSRTSNAEVWQRSAHVPMSKLLERKQLLLLGKDSALPPEPPSETSLVWTWHIHCCYISISEKGRPAS